MQWVTRLLAATLLMAGCAPPTTQVSSREFGGYPGPVWTDESGAQVSPDLIVVVGGPSHCGWESAAFLAVGWPLGTSTTKSGSTTRQYVRDPEGLFSSFPELQGQFVPETSLPEDSEFTGYRTEKMELWLTPSQPDAAYIVFDQAIERWPRAEPELGCA